MFLPRNPKTYPHGFGAGSGMSASAFSQPFAPSNHHQSLFSHQHAHAVPARSAMAAAGPTSNKRRHERDEDDDDENADAMDRSPTPEQQRPRKTAPKRLRMAQQPPAGSDGGKDKGEPKSDAGQDVGVLLARLPPQSLLPILTSLITSQPHLKPVVLALIPRPTLETALQALQDAARKLRDAYPYSQAPTFAASTSFGFGFGSPAPAPKPSGMRDEYVLSRLRPPIAEFVSTAFSYLSYFSYTRPADQSQSLAGNDNPSQVYIYLAALTDHVLSQPPLAVNALCADIQPRLAQEWEAWVTRVDMSVNKEGGMFPAGLVQGWADQLDKFATQTQYPLGVQMKTVRDNWVHRCGWLIGRNFVAMDDDL